MLVNEQLSGLSYTTLIPPTSTDGAQPSESTPGLLFHPEDVEIGKGNLDTIVDAEIDDFLSNYVKFKDDIVKHEESHPDLFSADSSLPTVPESPVDLGRPGWLDPEPGTREDEREWWELSNAELLALFPEGSYIPDQRLAALLDRLRREASITPGEINAESSGANYQSATEEVQPSGGEEEVDSGEIQPDYSDRPQRPSDHSQLHFVAATNNMGWILEGSDIVGIYQRISKSRIPEVYLTPQQVQNIKIPTLDLFPLLPATASSSSSSSSSSSITTTQTSSSPSPSPPPYRYIRDPTLPGNQGVLVRGAFQYGTWRQIENNRAVRTIFANPIPWKQSGSSSQPSCLLTDTCDVARNREDEADSAAALGVVLPLLRPASRVAKHHRHRPAPILNALVCGSSGCSSFDDNGCGDTCKCIAKPDVKAQGNILWLGSCMAWNAPLQSLSGIVSSAAGSGGRRKGKLRRREKRGLFMDSQEGKKLDEVDELDGLDKLDQMDQMDQMELACPCNVSYVSSACCGAEHGLVWEGLEMKLGVLTTVEEELK